MTGLETIITVAGTFAGGIITTLGAIKMGGRTASASEYGSTSSAAAQLGVATMTQQQVEITRMAAEIVALRDSSDKVSKENTDLKIAMNKYESRINTLERYLSVIMTLPSLAIPENMRVMLQSEGITTITTTINTPIGKS